MKRKDDDGDAERSRLASILLERSLRRGEFTLASGASSSYYIDARRTTMSGEGQLLIGRLGLRMLAETGWHPEVVGGLTLGADPVSYALAHASARARASNGSDGPKDSRSENPVSATPIDAFTVRKAAKEHGTGRRIEGGFRKGARVVIVEDVVTSGGSALSAAEVVSAAGGVIQGVFAVVDREQGGRERLLEAGYRLLTMFTASELLDEE